MIEDVARRSTLLVYRGQRWLIRSADPALIALVTHDRRLRALCEAVGDNCLAMLSGAETKFRAALQWLGYLVPASK